MRESVKRKSEYERVRKRDKEREGEHKKTFCALFFLFLLRDVCILYMCVNEMRKVCGSEKERINGTFELTQADGCTAKYRHDR